MRIRILSWFLPVLRLKLLRFAGYDQRDSDTLSAHHRFKDLKRACLRVPRSFGYLRIGCSWTWQSVSRLARTPRFRFGQFGSNTTIQIRRAEERLESERPLATCVDPICQCDGMS